MGNLGGRPCFFFPPKFVHLFRLQIRLGNCANISIYPKDSFLLSKFCFCLFVFFIFIFLFCNSRLPCSTMTGNETVCCKFPVPVRVMYSRSPFSCENKKTISNDIIGEHENKQLEIGNFYPL